MLSDYAYVGVMLIVSVAFVGIAFLIARILRPRRPDPRKLSTYECGEAPVGSSWIQFNVRYYVLALIFVIFDVETIFLYPWAVVYRRLGLFAFVEMFIFILILLVGLIYAWRKGALRWV
jgi:NADH-quinone oxidoreductase subunit A